MSFILSNLHHIGYIIQLGSFILLAWAYIKMRKAYITQLEAHVDLLKQRNTEFQATKRAIELNVDLCAALAIAHAGMEVVGSSIKGWDTSLAMIDPKNEHEVREHFNWLSSRYKAEWSLLDQAWHASQFTKKDAAKK